MKRISKRKIELSERITDWIGSTQSIIVHFVFIFGIFFFQLINISLNTILLVLTTFLSVEAIFLSIFIQMSVNRTTDTIEEISEVSDDGSFDKEISSTLRTIETRLNRLQNDLKSLKDKGIM